MYSHILVALENSAFDETILKHIRPLAKLTGATLTLIHVADGFFARNQERFGESVEIKEDEAYLESRRMELSGEGFEVKAVLAYGEPTEQIITAAEDAGCDLIAMSTHGHRGLSDLIFGSVASAVRHRTDIPLLLVRGKAVV
jgi:nucleotide-binding universal stress UspA family protein